ANRLQQRRQPLRVESGQWFRDIGVGAEHFHAGQVERRSSKIPEIQLISQIGATGTWVGRGFERYVQLKGQGEGWNSGRIGGRRAVCSRPAQQQKHGQQQSVLDSCIPRHHRSPVLPVVPVSPALTIPTSLTSYTADLYGNV